MLLILYMARYLLSVLTTKEMPKEEEEFFENLKVYFPNIYDVKFMMGDVNLWGGLKDVADSLGVERIGYQHQAGSDSLLTGQTFFKMKKQYFNDDLDDTKVWLIVGLGGRMVLNISFYSTSATYTD